MNYAKVLSMHNANYNSMKKLILIISLFSLWAGAFDASARYKGDLNGDDRVDLADMVYLAKAIKSGSTDKALDINASGKVDDYDLQKLADIIISGALNEDTGMNVGIGGWDDSGEDLGGTVKAPAISRSSSQDIHLYVRDARSEEKNGNKSIEFGISGGKQSLCAILVKMKVPDLDFDSNKIVELDETVLANHKLYGNPTYVSESIEVWPWHENRITFIIFSNDLATMSLNEGKLGRLFYSCGLNFYDNLTFEDCQVFCEGDSEVVTLPSHSSDYIDFSSVELIKDLEDNTACDVYTTNGVLLKKSATSTDIDNLSTGIYIIRQGGTTTKLLK